MTCYIDLGAAAPVSMVESQDQSNLVISWTNVTGADRYDTELRYPNETVVPGASVSRISFNLVNITNLPFGRNYIVAVCSVNDGGRTCGLLNVTGCEY